MTRKLLERMLLIWAVTATILLVWFPSVSLRLENWVHRRESMQGRVFLMDRDADEFVAYGDEKFVQCERPCSVEPTDGDLEMACQTSGIRPAHCVGHFRQGVRYLVVAVRLARSQPQ